MTREESLEVTAHVSKVIAQNSPRISYTPKDLKDARATYSDEKLRLLEEKGFYSGDFELFYIMLRFCDGMDLWKRADEEYLRALFARARKMDRREFYRNPYLEEIRIEEKRMGDFLLTQAEYEAGEFFQYDMPCLEEEVVVPKIGFFPQKVAFPALYEKSVPWVSVCPSEIHSMAPDLADARGKVLVLGLGLGYYPFMISKSDKVERVTIVEKSPQVIRLFRETLLPQFSHKEKIRVVEADAFQFLENTRVGEFDFCYADVWEGWADGAEAYKKILPQEKRLAGCEFRYWIKNEILWYIKNG